jgi:hypothetical protein
MGARSQRLLWRSLLALPPGRISFGNLGAFDPVVPGRFATFTTG